MVRFGDKSTCVGCGFSKSQNAQPPEGSPAAAKENQPADLQPSIAIIRQKIIQLSSDIAGENDIMLQRQKAELLEIYLRILEKLRTAGT
jgi:hypothetical protein